MKRGEVYAFVLDPTIGSEQRKTRRCVVVRRNAPSDAAERSTPMTIVAPLTDAHGKTANLLNVAVPRGVGGTTKDSLVLVAQLRAVDKKRLATGKLGELPSPVMARVDEGLKAVLNLD